MITYYYFIIITYYYEIIIAHYYIIITSLLLHYYFIIPNCKKTGNNEPIKHNTHCPCFHYYFVITHYYAYYPLSHVTKWATWQIPRRWRPPSPALAPALVSVGVRQHRRWRLAALALAPSPGSVEVGASALAPATRQC